MFVLFGPTLTTRARLLSTDVLVVGDLAADATGATAVKIAASNLLFKNSAGVHTVPDTGLDEKLRFQGANSFIGFYNSGATVRQGYIGQFGVDQYHWNDSVGAVIFGTSNVERMRILAAGNVGINCIPDSRFRVLDSSGASIRIGFLNTSANYLDADAHHFRSGSASARIVMDSLAGIRPAVDGNENCGSAAYRFNTYYGVSGAISTSDERAKTEIGEIPDKWLDAWAAVEWHRFKFKDRSRWHIGLIAQRVHAAFAAHDLDAFEIGLCCYDKWDDLLEPVIETVVKTRAVVKAEMVEAGEDENGEALFRVVKTEVVEEYEDFVDTGRTRIALEAGDRWGLRYDECLALEAALNRRQRARQAAALVDLQEKLDALLAGSSKG